MPTFSNALYITPPFSCRISPLRIDWNRGDKKNELELPGITDDGALLSNVPPVHSRIIEVVNKVPISEIECHRILYAAIEDDGRIPAGVRITGNHNIGSPGQEPLVAISVLNRAPMNQSVQLSATPTVGVTDGGLGKPVTLIS